MNALGRLALNNPARTLAQRRYVLPRLDRLGGRLDGCRVFEVGCGRGVGTMLLVEQLGANHVDAIDVDPVMVGLADRRLGGRRFEGRRLAERVTVRVADVLDRDAPAGSYDAVVDLGALHLEPAWRDALREIHRLLAPEGRLFLEEIVGPVHQSLVPLATGRRILGGISRDALLAEIDTVGFDLLGVAEPRVAVLTGVVGDLLAVARKR
jgi:cyclopropane fatty-acyl-phospholipid synthase-like methyltransferase